MTTHLTNIFTSARLLAATMTSILLLGILAPTASSGTSDGFLNFSNKPFVRAEPTITTFDAPGAGTGPGQGTQPFAINPAGLITGFYLDAGDVYHGVLRTPDGAITTFDAPGAGTGPGQGTRPFSINPGGTISGRYVDAGDVGHGFLRTPDGAILPSTSRVRAQVPARAPTATTSIRRRRSRHDTATRAVCITASCALRTAPSLRLMLRTPAQAPARAPLFLPSIASTLPGRSRQLPLTLAMCFKVSCALRTALSPRSMLRA